MLLTGSHIRALFVLMASEAAGHSGHAVAPDENDVYRELELQGLARPIVGQAYTLTYAGREALRLTREAQSAELLPPTEQLRRDWRYLGAEVLAALAAAGRAGGRVGPLAVELLQERGLAEMYKDPDRKIRYPRLTKFGTDWLDFAQKYRPRLEVTGALANSVHDMLPVYADPHQVRVPPEHRAQLEAMRLLVWSIPTSEVFTFTALGRAVYEALTKGGFPIEDVVLDDAILTLLATVADKGAGEIPQERLADVQMLGYVDAEGALTPAGRAALRTLRLRDKPSARPPATFTMTRHEAELLDVVHELSVPHFDPTHLSEKPPKPTTKEVLHRALVDSLEKRYEAFVGKYGRKIHEVPARKRQQEEMLAEMRDRDRVFGEPDDLDELLMHLESFELLRREAEGQATVFRLTPNGQRVVQEQGKSPRAITGKGVKAVTITTMAGHYYAPVASWIEQAREEELIGPGGISEAGNFYAWLAETAKRWPALSRFEVRTLLNLPQDESQSADQSAGRQGRAPTDDEESLEHALDRLEARGLIERMSDGQIVRTDAGQILMRAVAGATELAHPITPAIVRLLLAIRQVGQSLYVKEPKVRIQPRQWVEVERLTELGPDEFRQTVRLAKIGDYIGEANLREAGEDVLEAFARANNEEHGEQ